MTYHMSTLKGAIVQAVTIHRPFQLGSSHDKPPRMMTPDAQNGMKPIAERHEVPMYSITYIEFKTKNPVQRK